MNVKICPACKIEKPTDKFYKNKSQKNGLDSQCKMCKQGYWKTPAGKKARRKYVTSPKGIIRQREDSIKYESTTNSKITRGKYRNSPGGKISQKKGKLKYMQTTKGQETTKNYRKTPMAKEARKIYLISPEGKLYAKNHKLKSRYGITLEEYNMMLKNQGSVCAVCGGDNFGNTFHVDHNHTTNKIRGLLCNNCNTVLGHSKDSIEVLLKAIEYLKSWQ